jgi:5'-methylthioadenosine phosphorylase
MKTSQGSLRPLNFASDRQDHGGSRPAIGIIGGTGLYDLPDFERSQWVEVGSAFGKPSDKLLVGEYHGQRLVFLPRHGRGHRIPPTEINYRANIEAMKRAGVNRIISFSAVGSLKPELTPGTFVIVDQYIDRTFAREKSFFGAGFVAHVSMADPVCAATGDALEKAARSAGVKTARGGTYVVMEGPQFSTRAESELHRSWGADLIGMTNMPEAKLAREAEICYATVAMVTDYDCWHDEHAAVSTASVLDVLRENAGHARSLVTAAVPLVAAIATPCPSGCHHALEHAIATAPESRDPQMVAKLSHIAGRVSGKAGW